MMTTQNGSFHEARHDDRIDAALELAAQTNQALMVRQLAAVAGLSPSRFSHLFVLQTGVLPGQYLRRIRHCVRSNR